MDRIIEHHFKIQYQNAAKQYESDAQITLGSEYGMQRRISSFLKVFEKYRKKKAKILDVGCGPGIYARILYDLGHEITAIDQLEPIIKIAINRFDGREINSCIANVYELPFKSNSFDVIVCIGVFQHISDYSAAIKEFKRVLKEKGGTLFLITLNSLCIRAFYNKLIYLFSGYICKELKYNPFILKNILKQDGYHYIKLNKIILLPQKMRFFHNFNVEMIMEKLPLSLLFSHEFLIVASLKNGGG